MRGYPWRVSKANYGGLLKLQINSEIENFSGRVLEGERMRRVNQRYEGAVPRPSFSED